MWRESAEVVVFTAFALAFALTFAPAPTQRRSLMFRGGVGLAGTIAIAAVPTFELSLLALLVLGVLHAPVNGKHSFATRLRGPMWPVALSTWRGAAWRRGPRKTRPPPGVTRSSPTGAWRCAGSASPWPMAGAPRCLSYSASFCAVYRCTSPPARRSARRL